MGEQFTATEHGTKLMPQTGPGLLNLIEDLNCWGKNKFLNCLFFGLLKNENSAKNHCQPDKCVGKWHLMD